MTTPKPEGSAEELRRLLSECGDIGADARLEAHPTDGENDSWQLVAGPKVIALMLWEDDAKYLAYAANHAVEITEKQAQRIESLEKQIAEMRQTMASALACSVPKEELLGALRKIELAEKHREELDKRIAELEGRNKDLDHRITQFQLYADMQPAERIAALQRDLATTEGTCRTLVEGGKDLALEIARLIEDRNSWRRVSERLESEKQELTQQLAARDAEIADRKAANLALAELATARLVELGEKSAEVERLREVIAESNEVCACGCPGDAHENYGEDGEGCGIDSHECVRTCVAVCERITQLELALVEATELRATIDLIHDADMRGIALWRAEDPERRELISPDKAKMVCWLMERLDAAREENDRLLVDAAGDVAINEMVNENAKNLRGMAKEILSYLGFSCDPFPSRTEVMNRATQLQAVEQHASTLTRERDELREALVGLMKHMGSTVDIETELRNGVMVEASRVDSKRFMDAYDAAVNVLEPPEVQPVKEEESEMHFQEFERGFEVDQRLTGSDSEKTGSPFPDPARISAKQAGEIPSATNTSTAVTTFRHQLAERMGSAKQGDSNELKSALEGKVGG